MGKKGGKNKKINKRENFVKIKPNENLILLIGVIFLASS